MNTLIMRVGYLLLFLCLNASLSAQLSFAEIQNDLQELLVENESFTHPYKLINKELFFGAQDSCEINIGMAEKNIEDESLPEIEIYYAFHASNISLKADWPLVEDIMSLPIRNNKLHITLFKEGEFVDRPKANTLEIVVLDGEENEVYDLIETLADKCKN